MSIKSILSGSVVVLVLLDGVSQLPAPSSALSASALQQGVPSLAPMLQGVTPAVVSIRTSRQLDMDRRIPFNGRLPEAAPLSPLELLSWPGVVCEEKPDTGPLVKSTLVLLDQALDELLASREREGEQIKGLLVQRCDAMSELVVQARGLLPEIRNGLRVRLEARLAELDTEADPGRLEQELVMQIQKMDVDEELDRLEGHIGELRRVLERDEPIGRRMDFLMQELNREANTLGSKSVAAGTTNISVELKVLIEQLREQIQNVE